MRRSMRHFVIALALIQSTSASSSFSPNCTIPPEVVNFVSATGVRGTLDILWSSLFTLLICTWTVQHLNVPEQTPDPETRRQMLKETLSRSLTKVKWMLVTLIVPEFLVGRAFQDWMMARKSFKEMQEFARKDDVSWTLTHAYYANMGGFILRVDSTAPPDFPRVEETKEIPNQVVPISSPVTSQTPPASRSDILPTEKENSEMPSTSRSITHQVQDNQLLRQSESSPGERQAFDASDPSMSSEESTFAYPNADQLYILRHNSAFPKLPSISLKQIQDKSKSDAFIKGTALLQVLWLIIQIIVRGAKHLPVSQLEIAVLAFAACTILTYGFSWSKPQNITVADLASPSAVPLTALLALKNQNYQVSWFQALTMQDAVNILRPIPNDADVGLFAGSEFLTLTDVGIVLAGTIFGALHLIAWDFHFPSSLEALLWKLSSIFLAAVLPLFYVSGFLFEKAGLLKGIFHRSRGESKLSKGFVMKIMVYVCLSSYVLARICLMVLVFRSLFFLDPGTFSTTWAKEVPHLQ